jgi:hypothetical protein
MHLHLSFGNWNVHDNTVSPTHRYYKYSAYVLSEMHHMREREHLSDPLERFKRLSQSVTC